MLISMKIVSLHEAELTILSCIKSVKMCLCWTLAQIITCWDSQHLRPS